MSTNVRTSAVLHAAVRSAMCRVPQALLAAGHTSSTLTGMAEQQLRDPQALLSDGPVVELLAGPAAGLGAHADAATARLLDEVAARRRAGRPLLAADAGQLLTSLSGTLASLERETLTELVTRTLIDDLGAVSVQSRAGEQVTGVEARFDDGGCLLVAVEPQAVITDQADAAGRCGMRQHALEQGLAARGLTVRREAADPHQTDVGPLIAAAARAGAPTLADAVSRMTATGPRPSPGRRPSTGTRRTDRRPEQQVGR